MSKRQVSKTVVTTTMISRSSFANKFLDQREHAKLAIDLQSSAAEIQNLSATLIQLNSRLVVQNDLNQDVAEHKKLLAENEEARESL